MELIFLEPVFKEKLWGGNKLNSIFNFNCPSKTGEAWVISGYPNESSKIKSPENLKGKTLEYLYKNFNELFFGDEKKYKNKFNDDSFPILVKIIDATDDLSVQVHPNNEYSYKNENERGKTECWYILDASEDAKIIYGHNAENKEQLKKMIDDGNWKDLLIEIPVKKGDFFNVPYGTVHAILKNILVLETQSSSDITYRLYDFDRIDKNGVKRELHIKDSINVINTPFKDPTEKIHIINKGDNKISKLLKCDVFELYKYECVDEFDLDLEKTFYLMTVIEGQGNIFLDNNSYKISIGDSFIIPYGNKKVKINGNVQIISSKIVE